MHLVGILICDEVQNLTNSHKGSQTVMTELVSACNDLHVPILFIGTNKAAKILSLDFRQSRRASGHGIAPWDRFPGKSPPGEVDEWREFVGILWKNQWVRKPVPLSEQILDVMHHYSQGVIDIAIKLFASCQARAMLDGSEAITSQLIADVYNKELRLLHPMVEALRNDDIEALAAFDDIAPIGLLEIIGGINRKLQSQASPLYKVKSGDPTYLARIANSLVAVGFGESEALAAAENTIQPHQNLTLIEGTKAALSSLTLPSKVPRAKKDAEEPAAPDFRDRPQDYRRAIYAAKENKSTILGELRNLGMATQLEELLELG